MVSFISTYRKELGEGHYIRKAGTENYWFDFSKNQVSEYNKRTGGSFCLIISGSDDTDDAYVMPYSEIYSLLDENKTDDRGRWIGTISNDVLRMHTVGLSMQVGQFYNKFEILDKTSQDLKVEQEPVFEILENDVLSIVELKNSISKFNKLFESATPQRKVTISERISRPGAIAELLKRANQYVCQICKVEGFKKKNGALYAEAHHLIELHRLVIGSHCSDNIIVVCPTCHKKLHFSEVILRNVTEKDFEIKLGDGTWQRVNRNIFTKETTLKDHNQS